MNTGSEYYQDLWVSYMLPINNGFFVELGARDGIQTSNTLYLERIHEWTGILVECCPRNFIRLKENRLECKLDNRLLYNTSSKEIDFYPGISSGIGSINFTKGVTRKDPIKIETVTLSDLLNYHEAPHNIDYISMDIEGAELPVLEGFNWEYKVKLWTIECGNYDKSRRKKIRKIMYKHGYTLFKQNICNIEDWWYL